jgi:2'-hydroxyisoflavone reductase
VEASAAALKDAAETYCFISTISVYDDDQADEITEETRVGTLEDETVEEISGGTYGPLKVLCEKVTEKYFPQRALNVRCGLIVGPRDPTNRFGYWVKHLHKSSEILAPSGPDLSLQIIDVRDLADSTIRMIEAKKAGIYNFVGPRDPITLPEVLNRIKAELKTDANFVWVDDQFLVEHEVVPWGGLPLWLPPPDNGVMRVSAKKAIGDGLTYRPLEDTIRHSFEWLHEADDVDPNKRAPGQISAEREAELINLWRAKQQA